MCSVSIIHTVATYGSTGERSDKGGGSISVNLAQGTDEATYEGFNVPMVFWEAIVVNVRLRRRHPKEAGKEHYECQWHL